MLMNVDEDLYAWLYHVISGCIVNSYSWLYDILLHRHPGASASGWRAGGPAKWPSNEGNSACQVGKICEHLI